jgi:hypothetical protein
MLMKFEGESGKEGMVLEVGCGKKRSLSEDRILPEKKKEKRPNSAPLINSPR